MNRLAAQLREVAARTPLAASKRFRRAARPVRYPALVRIGSGYGGWAVPDDLVDATWICYSGGVGLDVSFDVGFIERYGCTVHAFDPTPSAIEYVRELTREEERFRFYPWGMSSDDGERRFYAPEGVTNFSVVDLHGTNNYFEAQCKSLRSIMNELGHERIDLLKLDIEGAEYGVLRSVIDGDVEPIVVCVEFHKTPGITEMVDATKALRARSYLPVCVDGFDVTFVRR